MIHVQDESQARENLMVARDMAADGAFLINHSISSSQLLRIYENARVMLPHFWIGINMLDLWVGDAMMQAPDGLSGLWVDNPEINESESDPLDLARSLWEKKQKRLPDCIYFGSVAFKGQKRVKNLAGVARLSIEVMDVVTTSGRETGSPPDLGKIKVMREAIGAFPFAIASGMTQENVGPFLNYVDAFLVSTGISKDFYTLDPEKVRAMVRTIKGFSPLGEESQD